MAKLKIKATGKETKIYLDGEPVELNRLIGISLDMNAKDGNILTLTYRVHEVDIETNDAEVEILNEE